MFIFKLFSDHKSNVDATLHAEADDDKSATDARTAEVFVAVGIYQDHMKSVDAGVSAAIIAVDQEPVRQNEPVEAGKPPSRNLEVKAALPKFPVQH